MYIAVYGIPLAFKKPTIFPITLSDNNKIVQNSIIRNMYRLYSDTADYKYTPAKILK